MSKRVIMVVFAVLIAIVAAAGPVGALGLGVILGEPTGLSFKQWIVGGNAIGGAAAWSFEDESAFHVHVDYLYHRPGPAQIDAEDEGRLLWYFGIGGRLKAEEDDSRIGVRVPLGVDYVFSGAPLDIFLEVAPLLDLAPGTDFRLHGGFGIRYYF
jgi:hypothetical protein